MQALGPRTRKGEDLGAWNSGWDGKARLDENEDVFLTLGSAPLQGFDLNGKRTQVVQRLQGKENGSDQILKTDDVDVDPWVDTDSVSDIDPMDLS